MHPLHQMHLEHWVHRVPLEPGPLISGMVVRDGAPMEGAYVRLIGPSGEYVSERRTAADGCFKFHVAPGADQAWRIVAYGPETERVEQTIPPDGDETMIVDISKRS